MEAKAAHQKICKISCFHTLLQAFLLPENENPLENYQGLNWQNDNLEGKIEESDCFAFIFVVFMVLLLLIIYALLFMYGQKQE